MLFLLMIEFYPKLSFQKDKKYKYNDEIKNIVKVKIDIFPIGQQEGEGHVIEELPLNNEKQDTKFVLSKSNINSQKTIAEAELKDINQEERIDLSDKNSFMFKNWSTKNSPILPIIHIENNKDKITNFGYTQMQLPKD